MKKAAKEPTIEKLMTVSEVSSLLGFSKTFINKAKNELGLKSYKLGGSVRFKKSDVNNWIEERGTVL